MKLQNAFDVPLSPADTWRVLLDIERVAPCLPGAELLETLPGGAYKGKVAVRLGPVAVSFLGTARFEEVNEGARRVRVRASGTEEKGRGGAQAVVEFALTETGPRATHVAIATDLTLNGAVAQYGRGAAMIEDVAQQMVRRFADTLKVQIEGSRAERADALAEARKPVSGFALFFGALWRALKRLFGAKRSLT
ncbi:MAG TPA: SRPBCC family protein [Stellaceae bacterium]|nr:SRPBCC family protein [Stellaceae bacterium]